MRSAIIPAQIITIEDKIAGSLSLSQIVILIIPLISTMIIYLIFPPVMKFSLYKAGISLVIAALFLPLAMRIKEKIIFQWLIILLRYTLKPGYYLFNKNDITQRIIDTTVIKKKTKLHHVPLEEEVKQEKYLSGITELIRFEKLITNPALSLRFKTNKKGGLNIAIDQIKQ